MKYLLLHKNTIIAVVGCFATLMAAAICTMLIWRSRSMKMALPTMTNELVPIYCVETDKKVISLGINCAWDDEDVDEWLKVLDDENVKATFFVVGNWCDKYSDSLKKIYEHGHEIGNHSDTHPDMTSISQEMITHEIESAGKKIQKITGSAPSLFRAPSGAYNDLVIKSAQNMGYTCIQWSVDSIDWKGLSSAEIEERVISRLDSGAITLFHQGKENSLKALPNIIKEAKAQGFSFVPVSELIYKDNYYINASGKQIPQNKSEAKV